MFRRKPPEDSRPFDTTGIHLVVGLGNPGAQYENTRHNVGFMALDALRARLTAEQPQNPYMKLRSNAISYEIDYRGAHLILAKPQTYVNRSGQSIKGLLKHYRLTIENLLVIHDDLDLTAGTVRIKVSGGHGGHNGLRSILAMCGEEFTRVKVGIGRPPGQMPAERYVLQELRDEALEALKVDANRAADVSLAILRDGIVVAQNYYNSLSS